MFSSEKLGSGLSYSGPIHSVRDSSVSVNCLHHIINGEVFLAQAQYIVHLFVYTCPFIIINHAPPKGKCSIIK